MPRRVLNHWQFFVTKAGIRIPTIVDMAMVKLVLRPVAQRRYAEVSRKSGKFRKSVLGIRRVDLDGDSRLSSSRFMRENKEGPATSGRKG
jgi:hypothetical protein